MTITAIDVSYAQGQINWDAVKASGVTFAITKCCEGTHVDNQFERNWSEMRRVGIRRGAYCFARADQSAAGTASFFTETVRKAGMVDSDVLALDVEHPSQTRRWALTAGEPSIDWVGGCLTSIERLSGRKPLFYTYVSFLSEILRNDRRLAAWPLWIAHLTDNAAPSAPWPYALWQYSWTGRVPGIRSNVDCDRTGPTWNQHQAPPEDDMPLNNDDFDAIRDIVKQELNDAIGAPNPHKPGEWTGRLGATLLHYTKPITDAIANLKQ